MSTDWLPGFERVFNGKYNGGTYEDGPPWRFVGHTVEGVPDSIAGAMRIAGQHANPPHLWAWPDRDWKCQTVRLDRSAFALLHPSGTPHTNKMKAIQCEVFGFAKDMESKPNWFWDWLGEEILRPVIAAGYPINLSHVAPTTGGDGYGAISGAVRFTRSEWRIFDGVCVHANVPDNSHWDMGKANLLRMAQAARGVEDDLDATERKWLQQTVTDVAILKQLLTPRAPLKVKVSGPEIGKPDENGKPVSDLWRWALNMELERQAGFPKLVDAIVAALPSEAGGAGLTEADVKAAVTSALQETGLMGLLPGQ